MRIAVHLTERLLFDWPLFYWKELIGKLTRRGHTVVAFSDEPQVEINDDNPLLVGRLHIPHEQAEAEIAGCDLFVGFPLVFADMAKRKGVRTLLLLAATNKGAGVKTSAPCGGCLDNVPGMNDCMFGDQLCLHELTPNDVLEAI